MMTKVHDGDVIYDDIKKKASMNEDESDLIEYYKWLTELFVPLIDSIPVLEADLDMVVDKENCTLGHVPLTNKFSFIEHFVNRCSSAIWGDAPPNYDLKAIELDSKQLAKNPDLLDQACLEDLITYVGNMDRIERINSGHLASMVEKGTFLAIAKRARSLMKNDRIR